MIFVSMHQQGPKRNLFIRAWFGMQTAVSGVFAHKLRSALTVLGVMIGVASLLVLLAIGHGAQTAIEEQFESLGANLIRVESHRWDIRLTTEDATEVTERVPPVIKGMPLLRDEETQVRYRRLVEDLPVIGVTENMLDVRDQSMEIGRFFSHLHVRERMQVAVLGHGMAEFLFGNQNPIGEGIYLEGQRFTIIGVLQEMGEGMADDIDSQIVVPITAAQRALLTGRVDELWFKASSAETVDPAIVQVSRIMRHKFNLEDIDEERDEEDRDEEPEPAASGGPLRGSPQRMVSTVQMDPRQHQPDRGDPSEPELTITNLNALVDEAGEASRVMTAMLAGIASVALLVGGLGIMNIMLVSVAERTREIGIRKALGAHPLDLVYQFIVEALLLSSAGGALGVAAGYVGAGVAGLYGIETLLTTSASMVAFFAAVGVGILFGVYPAYTAAQMEPVEALRHR